MSDDVDKIVENREVDRQKVLPQSELIKSILTMYERSFRLPAKPDCKELDEILNISPGELVDKDLRTCQMYLWALNQWTLYLRRERNLRLAYFTFDMKRPLRRMHAMETLKKTGRTKFERMAQAKKNPAIKKAELQSDVAEAYYLSMEGILDEANEMKQALKRIITTKQFEYEQSQFNKNR